MSYSVVSGVWFAISANNICSDISADVGVNVGGSCMIIYARRITSQRN